MKEWPLRPLGDAIEERRETPDSGLIATGELRVVERIRFDSGQIDFRDGVETRTKMILIHPGDLVLSGINAVKGAVGWYGDDQHLPAAATVHFGAYRVDCDLANAEYVWWLLRSKWFQKQLSLSLPRGVKTEVKCKHLLPQRVPLPSLDMQRIAVSRMRLADKKLRRVAYLRARCSEAARGLLGASLRSALENLPHDGRFGDVITFKPRSGPSFVTSVDALGHPVLMPSGVSGFGVNPAKVEFAVDDGVVPASKDILREGDVVIARGNKAEQVGNAGVVPRECEGWVCANLLMRLQVDATRVDPQFCVLWLRTPLVRDVVRRQMTGTSPSIQKINQRKILALPFPTEVPLSKQRELVRSLDWIDAQVCGLAARYSTFDSQLDSLRASLSNSELHAPG